MHKQTQVNVTEKIFNTHVDRVVAWSYCNSKDPDLKNTRINTLCTLARHNDLKSVSFMQETRSRLFITTWANIAS